MRSRAEYMKLVTPIFDLTTAPGMEGWAIDHTPEGSVCYSYRYGRPTGIPLTRPLPFCEAVKWGWLLVRRWDEILSPEEDAFVESRWYEDVSPQADQLVESRAAVSLSPSVAAAEELRGHFG
jgi:hypothetical protein